MTLTPETTTTDDKPHFYLAGLAQQGDYAYGFAKAGHQAEALEHAGAIERLIAAYRAALGTQDTLGAWLFQRFSQSAVTWEALDEDDRAYWEHHAAAVRRAVQRGGFKPEEPVA